MLSYRLGTVKDFHWGLIHNTQCFLTFMIITTPRTCSADCFQLHASLQTHGFVNITDNYLRFTVFLEVTHTFSRII